LATLKPWIASSIRPALASSSLSAIRRCSRKLTASGLASGELLQFLGGVDEIGVQPIAPLHQQGIEIFDRPQLDAVIGSCRGQGLPIAGPTHAQDTVFMGFDFGNRGAIALPHLDGAIVVHC
jgi:hypothetical protein